MMPTEIFLDRHAGATEADVQEMLGILGFPSLEALIHAAVPEDIRLREPLNLPAPRSEQEVLSNLQHVAQTNQVFRSFIGMGYYDCYTPPVILRNMLENPAWYTPYTPYQAEIAQGRLEALLNFQTMVADLTGPPPGQCFASGRRDRSSRSHGHVPNHQWTDSTGFFRFTRMSPANAVRAQDASRFYRAPSRYWRG